MQQMKRQDTTVLRKNEKNPREQVGIEGKIGALLGVIEVVIRNLATRAMKEAISRRGQVIKGVHAITWMSTITAPSDSITERSPPPPCYGSKGIVLSEDEDAHPRARMETGVGAP